MQKNILIILLFLWSASALAVDKVQGYVYDEKKQPVIGANVFWEKSYNGTVTNANGYFELEIPAPNERLVVRYTGYEEQKIEVEKNNVPLKIYLTEDSRLLGEVIINKRAPGTVSQRSKVIQTQKIGLGEIRRDACCNLGESFVTNPSVDVAYSDAATGAKQIKLLGLAGTYVQMLTENYPNFRGAASSFGMDYVPGSWMDGIYVSKGTSSVKNGYEALAGQINVEYKKPQTMDKFSFNQFVDNALRTETNADASWHISDNVKTAFFAHYSTDAKGHDRNNDGFLDFPKREQLNLMNRWSHESGKYIAQYGAKYIYEDREGGQDTRHHTFDNPYLISLKTNRGEFYTKQALSFGTGDLMESVALIASGSIHDQKSIYNKTRYNIRQKNLYLSLLYEKDFSKKHNLSTGLSLNYDDFKETLVNTPYDRRESVTGGYLQYTFNLNDTFIALGGIRADYSSLYGFFVTPRLHVKYMPTEWTHLRASIGKGFRTPNVLAENNYLLASSRKIHIADNLAQEEAWNSGINATFYIPIAGKEMTLSGEWYHTRFMKQVVVDVDSDPHAISFYNLENGKSYSNSAQIEMSYPFFRGFTLTAAYRYTQSKSDYRNPTTGVTQRLSKPLLNDYKGLITASYQTPLRKWQFDATTQFNGGGRMPTPEAMNPLWDTRFNPFTIVNCQITKFFRNASVYLGAENLFDFRQQNPIIDVAHPSGENFDATMIWGPVHGRKIFAGIRYDLPRF